MSKGITELSADQVRQACDPGQFTFRSTEELPGLDGVIGQDRAVRAISFGIGIKNPGYHMFALGPSGTGKTTTIQKFLERESRDLPVPDDWLYVNNFEDEDRPRAFRLPSGAGCRLKEDMDKFVDELGEVVPRTFESAEYGRQQEEVGGELQQRHQSLLEELEQYARERGFMLAQTPQGLMIAPIMDGDVLTPDQVRQLDESTRQQLDEHRHDVEHKLRDTMRSVQQLQREASERGLELDRKALAYTVDHLIDELKERYREHEPVVKLLDEIRKDIIDSVQDFKRISMVKEMQREQSPLAQLMGRQLPSFDKYRVNLIVDNCKTEGAPAILARNPSYHNLVGRIEHQGQFGTLVTNFMMIKGGLLHKANGGYLMIDIRDLLVKPLAYEGLKRALKNHMVEMETLAEAYGLFATRTLDPEPIPLDIKVILIGDPFIYYLLNAYDPEFQELFKVKADFSLRMERTPETTDQYARFIANVCREENLKHFDPSGVAKVVEHGSRLIAHREKLVTKFGDVVDLIRQSNYWASQNGNGLITGEDVKKAIDEKVYRSNQIEHILREMITEGTILIDTAGGVAGQINGLAVLSLGDYAFGKPTRVTARTHVGNAGVVSIDREVKMGGRIHNKGALILANFLGGKYATHVPLALAASITFEQVYEEIEGDSASSAELYALLSSLSGFPIRQDLAVTGSVNQHGQVQAIGGVNEKIEGFFDVCRTIGLTGTQGVLIPESNVKHLMLREDVVEAVRDGTFHIYPVATIDQGIEILTGQPAGERLEDGTYPQGSVNGTVQWRLEDLANKVKAFVKPAETSSDDEE
jgi:lon-related putative ATP-dependent protease